MTKKSVFTLVSGIFLLIFLFSACQWDCQSPVSNTTEVTTSGGTEVRVDMAYPNFEFQIEEIDLNIDGKEEYDLEIKDSSQNLLLYALQEERFDEGHFISYYVTREIGIYDTEENAVSVSWVPQKEGWYFAGAMVSDKKAVFGLIVDFSNAYPADYEIVMIDSNGQTVNDQIHGSIGAISALDAHTVVYSYCGDDSFGVRKIEDDKLSELLQWKIQEGKSEPLYGNISALNGQFAYECALDGCCVILVADSNGELYRIPLRYLDEKLDYFAMTGSGVVASLSLNEGQKDEHRELTIFTENNDRFAQRMEAPLYRMVFCDVSGFAINNFFELFFIYTGNTHEPHLQKLSALDESMPPAGSPVAVFRSTPQSSYLYYDTFEQMFLVKVAEP